MKPSYYLKRICAVVLALTMLSGIVSANLVGVVLAEPDTEPVETSAPEIEAPETEAPEDEAPETEVPETDAPEAEAPETEAPETEAPETEAPEIEAHENEAPETEVHEILCPECGGSNGAHSSNCPTLIKQYDAQVLAPNGQYYAMTLKGAIPEGLDVIVSAPGADFDPEYDIIKKKIAFAFDISLVDEYGNEWQPADDTVITMTVDATIAGMAEGESVEVYHIHGGTPKKLGVLTVVDGKISIETTGFSTFFGIQPRTTTASYIYFDLAAGNIEITSTTYTGYIYKFGTKESYLVTGNHTAANNYYVYQTNGTNHTTTGFDEVTGLVTIPTYNTVTYDGKTWGEFVTNNSNVESVISGWNSANKDGRVGTSHWISVYGSVSVNLTIDNLWSTRHTRGQGRTDGGIAYVPSGSKKVGLNIIFKGDNRFGTVYYASNNTNYSIVFNGDATATLTAADLDLTSSKNWWASAIGNNDNSGNAKGIIINSGIIYAGTTAADDCTAIGGGGNGHGIITINGGTVTAVCESSGAAIGGGIGKTAEGGQADVTITGGTVYAYNKSCTSLYNSGKSNYSLTGRKYIPAAAIGGGSSAQKKCYDCTVTITGGWVYAQAVGGTAIGGGSSADGNGGKATVRISGGTVYAKSIAGYISGQNVPAGAAIGGGTGGTKGNGGNAIIYIEPGATVVTGSMGGGETVGDKSIYKIGHAEFYVTGGDIKGQAVMAQGASPCKFEMSSGTWTTNEDTSYIYLRPDGGAVWMNDQNAIATMTGGTITGCRAENGGALYMKAGKFTMSGNSKIENCSATANGGAVYLGGGTATLSAGSIESCHAQTGGAIFLAGGTADVSGGNIKNCYSQNIDAVGGGIYVSDGNVIMSSGSIDGCMTKDPDGNINGYGGGVYITGGAMSLSGGEVKNNQASVGGGVYLPGGDFNMSGGTLYKNSATDEGGGVYLTDGGNLNMTGGTILENSATNDGGGVYLNGGNLNLNGADAKIKGNTAVNGAGVYLTGGVPGLYHGTLSENVAASSGGGIYIDKQVVKLSPTGTVLFEKNKATDGAGMYIQGEETKPAGFSVDDTALGSVEFSGNTATSNGGGVCLSYGDMVITNEQILLYGNEAQNGGGAAILNGNFTLSGGSIGVGEKNVNYAVNGGGIYVDGGNVTVSGTGTITNNNAQNGGGVYLSGGKFTLNGEQVYIKENSADNGGGVYLTEINPFLLAGNIVKNTATYNGGGIFIDRQVVELEPTGTVLFDENKATDGAGMYIRGEEAQPAGFTVKECSGKVVFKRNVATTSGGGVCVNNGSFTIGYDNIDIIENTAVNGGGIAVLSGNFNMNAGSIGTLGGANTATNGGGIYVAGGTATLGNCLVTYNTAVNGGGAYVSGGNLILNDGGSFIANSAVPNAGESANGGGFYVKGGSFTMNNGTVSKNSSSDGNGGGGYIDGGNFIMKNGVIGGDTADQANTAVNGGGICVSDGNVTVYNGSIKYNKALSDGGGVYVSSQTMEVRVVILSGYLMKNSADSVGGGMAVRSESSQPITVEIGCLLLHDGYPFDYVGEKYGVYSESGTHKHEFCPQVSGNVAGINGGGFYLDSSSAELYYYCIVEDPTDPNIANGNTNCHGLDVEGGRIEIGDSGYHNHLVDEEHFRDVVWGNVQLHSTILVNNGTVDIYGDMDNPYFGSKIMVDIKDASGYFKDHRRSISNNDYKIHYFENFDGNGKYIANQYAVENGVCEVPITGAAFERPGYKIEGWNTDPDGKGVNYLVGSVYDLVQLGEADGMGAAPGCKYCSTDSYCLILYAQWKKKGYIITYERNAPFGAVCTGDTPPQECTIGEAEKLRPNGFICAGYKFLGWSEDQYATNPDYPDEAEVIDLTLVDSTEVKLYAIWQKCTHIDTLAYEVSEDYEATIVEYCSACYGHIAYASLSATDETFDGNPHAATVSGDYNTPNWLGETPEVVYVKKKDPKWDTDDLDHVWATWGGEGSTEAPVHAGEYTASLTVDEVTTVSCEFTISPVKWTTPEKPGYVDAKVGGKDGVLAQPPESTVPGEAPKYEYRYQYLLDGTTYDFDWQDDEFIPTEHGNVFYYIYARAKADRDHIESDPSHFVLVLNGNAEVQWDIDIGIDVIEANIDGDNNLTFKAFAEENYHKRDWSVTLYQGSVENKPGTTITEQDGVYVLEALKTSDDVTYIVRITGVSLNANFEVKSTYDQVFDNFDNVTSFDISRDSSFTVQYTAKNYTPAEYGNEKDGYEALTFNQSVPEGVPKGVPAGTKIIMVLNGEYWYTVLDSPSDSIPLTEFWKMGSAGPDRYTRTDGNSPVNMTWQFAFDFSEVDESSYPTGDRLEVTFGAPKNPGSSEAPNFKLTENIGLVDCASFDLQCSEFIGNVATITYEYNKSNGHASIWQDRESALVITLSGTLPADLRLSTRLGQQTTLYSMSEGNQFIIPCGALTSGSNSIEIELISDLLGSVTEVTADVKWLVSASGADQSPLNGTEVGHVDQLVVNMQPALLPALKIDRITQPNSPVLNELRLCKLDGDYSVDVRTVNLPEDWTVTLYLYRKDTTVGSATEGQFLYTGFYEVLDTSQNNIRSKLSLRGQEEGTFYLYVVATVGEDASRVIKSEDKYFFIAEE